MTKRDEALPCPFCGDDSNRVMKLHGHYCVICNGCGARAWAFPHKSEAIKTWNRREGKSVDLTQLQQQVSRANHEADTLSKILTDICYLNTETNKRRLTRQFQKIQDLVDEFERAKG